MSSIPSSCIFIKLYRTVVCIEIKFTGKKSQLDISRATEAVAWRWCVKSFAKFREKHLCQSFFFDKVADQAWKFEKDSGAGVFLWILRNFLEHFFYRTLPVAASWANIIGLFWPNELLARRTTWETHIGVFSAWISTVNNTGHWLLVVGLVGSTKTCLVFMPSVMLSCFHQDFSR